VQLALGGSVVMATKALKPFVPAVPLQTNWVLVTSAVSRTPLPLLSTPASTEMPPVGQALMGAKLRTAVKKEFTLGALTLGTLPRMPSLPPHAASNKVARSSTPGITFVLLESILTPHIVSLAALRNRIVCKHILKMTGESLSPLTEHLMHGLRYACLIENSVR